RHTRFSRDWSSDVCSSDLHFTDFQSCRLFATIAHARAHIPPSGARDASATADHARGHALRAIDDTVRACALLWGPAGHADVASRSEERREGKGGRSVMPVV